MVDLATSHTQPRAIVGRRGAAGSPSCSGGDVGRVETVPNRPRYRLRSSPVRGRRPFEETCVKMKVEPKQRTHHSTAANHAWVSTSLVMIGLGILAVAAFWIKRCRQTGLPKHEYSALKTDGGERCKEEKQIRNGVYMVCKQHLENNDRYELKSQLEDIGSRSDKHWFTIQDHNLRAERLLTLLPLPPTCPLATRCETRHTLLELFRGLQHPYIHPVLDIEFWSGAADTPGGGGGGASPTPPAAALIAPLNPAGSLKDMIYGVDWREPYDRKYALKGQGLTLKTIQCLGRQILEGLLFLKNRYFPPIYHLHSGNVIIQNGVARLAGLENSLLGLLPRAPSAPAPLAFGYLLFEMAAGYELTQPPTAAHLQLELERAPKVAEALELVFRGERLPQLEELVRCDLFRGVELRELRGASVIQSVTPPDVMELLDVVKNPVPPSPLRRRHFTDDLEPWFA